MGNKTIAAFPSGWLVIVLLVASGVLWAMLFFVTLPHLQILAGGAAPFDLRWTGYSYDEARAFLVAIGEQGRAYYLNPELVLDTFFPPLYAASRALALWWLSMAGRLRDRAIPPGWRCVLIALPIVEAILDWGENTGIATMVWTWPALSPAVVHASSLATQLKLLAATLTEFSLIALAAVAALRRCRRTAAANA
jgi:hypothetical protein